MNDAAFVGLCNVIVVVVVDTKVVAPVSDDVGLVEITHDAVTGVSDVVLVCGELRRKFFLVCEVLGPPKPLDLTGLPGW